jgi:hypothetical protein
LAGTRAALPETLVTKGKLAVLVIVLAGVGAFFAFDLRQYFSIEYFQSQRAAIDAYYAANPAQTAAVFFAIYVVVTGLSLPGAAIMTLVAGALFGLLWGVVVVSFASTIGATLAFLASRYLLRDWVQGRFGDKLKTINDGVEKEGAFYLFALRLVPAFPLLPHQPRDGPHEDAHADLLLGEPARHARRAPSPTSTRARSWASSGSRPASSGRS